jgi:serine/threonine-protein kinase
VISFEGVVKVVDFGIAKAEMRETQTRSGTIKGKFAYMSPEQCVANNVDRRTDVFALGVITHELLTGKRLFKRPSPYDTYQAVIECKVLPPSKMNREIDPELDAVIMKSLAKDKVNRYPTAEAFGDALLSYLHHRGIASSGNEVSRFFDTTFNQEIEEHGARMRELISGREIGVNGWDEEDEKPDSQDDKAGKGNATVDVKLGASGRAKAASNKGDEASMVLETRDLEMMPADRPSTASLDDVIGDLQDDPAADPDADASDMPADRTRIEANPLDLIAELAKTSAQADAAKVTKQSAPLARSQPPGAPVVMPIAGPPSGALALPDPPASPAGSLKFPNLSNLPTMIADLEEDSKAGSEPESEPTSMAPANMLPSRRQPLPHVSDSPEIAAAAAAAVVPMVATPGPMPAYSSTPPPAMAPAPVIPLGPNGYPVLPSGAAALANGAAALANGHFNNVGAPNVAYAGHAGGAPGGFDPAHAAHLMSPVGDQFPQMDWDAAAAMPAKAIPRWLLAVLFSGALLGALLLTVLIARALRHH